jgi:pSer/pThr/pTyr-binding forkhead associated (FHA) protein
VQLTSSASGCVIEDLNSTNGVFIGDDEVVKQILVDGDIISLGTHELVYADLRNTDEGSKDNTSANENQA